MGNPYYYEMSKNEELKERTKKERLEERTMSLYVFKPTCPRMYNNSVAPLHHSSSDSPRTCSRLLDRRTGLDMILCH